MLLPHKSKSSSLHEVGNSASSSIDLMEPIDAERQDNRRPAVAGGCVPCAMIVEVMARFGRCGKVADGGGGRDATEGSAEVSEGTALAVDGVTLDAMMTGNGGLGW